MPFALPALWNVDTIAIAPTVILDHKVTFEKGSHTLRTWEQREEIWVPDFFGEAIVKLPPQP